MLVGYLGLFFYLFCRLLVYSIVVLFVWLLSFESLLELFYLLKKEGGGELVVVVEMKVVFS